jgi:hypothetical protein
LWLNDWCPTECDECGVHACRTCEAGSISRAPHAKAARQTTAAHVDRTRS